MRHQVGLGSKSRPYSKSRGTSKEGWLEVRAPLNLRRKMAANCGRSQHARLRHHKLLYCLHVKTQPQILSIEAHMGNQPRKEARAAKNSPSLKSGATGIDTAGLSGPALRAFFAVGDKWRLSAWEERVLLGCPPRSTFARWKIAGRGRLGPDALDRISFVLSIYRALHELFPQPNQADSWVRRPNAFFNGNSALQRMLGGGMTDLGAVRQLLDSHLS